MTVAQTATSSALSAYQGQPSSVLLVSAPSAAPTLALAANAGSTLPATTYYVKFTWVNATGETTASPEASLAVTSGNQLNVTLPAFPSGVTSANVYISTTTGNETKQGNTNNTSYAQSSALIAGANPPTINTTTAYTLYTAPAADTAVTSPDSTSYIKEIIVCNTTSAAANFFLYLVPSGGSASASNAMYYNVSVAAYDTKVLTGLNTFMPPGSALMGYQPTAGAITLTIGATEVQ